MIVLGILTLAFSMIFTQTIGVLSGVIILIMVIWLIVSGLLSLFSDKEKSYIDIKI